MDLEPWRQAWRTAETPEASTVHHPFGKPGGPGLWHTGKELPAYIQNVAHAFRRKGMPESEAISQAVGVVRNWAEGHDGHGHKVHPDVQAAAGKAIAEWEKLRAEAHATGPAKRSDGCTAAWQRAFGPAAARGDPFHVPAGHAGGGQFASASGSSGGAGAKPGKPASAHRPAGKTAAPPAPPPKEKAADARQRHRLLEEARADRQHARQLEAQLHALESQRAASAAAAKKSAATAKTAAKAGHAAAHKRHTATHHHHTSHARSLKQRISALRTQISGLRKQASELEARARAV